MLLAILQTPIGHLVVASTSTLGLNLSVARLEAFGRANLAANVRAKLLRRAQATKSTRLDLLVLAVVNTLCGPTGLAQIHIIIHQTSSHRPETSGARIIDTAVSAMFLCFLAARTQADVALDFETLTLTCMAVLGLACLPTCIFGLLVAVQLTNTLLLPVATMDAAPAKLSLALPGALRYGAGHGDASARLLRIIMALCPAFAPHLD